MEELLQEISNKISSLIQLPSCSDLFELVKSGFFALFSSIYNFIFVDCKELIFSVGDNFFGLVYSSVSMGNFVAFFIGTVIVVSLFKVVIHIVRG